MQFLCYEKQIVSALYGMKHGFLIPILQHITALKCPRIALITYKFWDIIKTAHTGTVVPNIKMCKQISTILKIMHDNIIQQLKKIDQTISKYKHLM